MKDPKKVSVVDLKKNLSQYINAVGNGQILLITNHHVPVAMLTRVDSNTSVHVATERAPIVPLLDASTGGRYLEVLMEDRDLA